MLGVGDECEVDFFGGIGVSGAVFFWRGFVGQGLEGGGFLGRIGVDGAAGRRSVCGASVASSDALYSSGGGCLAGGSEWGGVVSSPLVSAAPRRKTKTMTIMQLLAEDSRLAEIFRWMRFGTQFDSGRYGKGCVYKDEGGQYYIRARGQVHGPISHPVDAAKKLIRVVTAKS